MYLCAYEGMACKLINEKCMLKVRSRAETRAASPTPGKATRGATISWAPEASEVTSRRHKSDPGGHAPRPRVPLRHRPPLPSPLARVRRESSAAPQGGVDTHVYECALSGS